MVGRNSGEESIHHEVHEGHEEGKATARGR